MGRTATGVATGPTATAADGRCTRSTSARGAATPTAGPTPARELAEPLADHVAGLGFTHLELMPVASHPFGGSWGYQVSGYYAPDARLGSPDDLRHLIDVCHDRGLGVIVDWVPAHFPRDEFALARFDGTALYEHVDPRRGEHPDWGTLVFNHGRNEVRNFLVANALYWLEEFHADGLRVDAVASMLHLDYSRRAGEWVPNEHGGREDLDAVAFVRELNGVGRRGAPGRRGHRRGVDVVARGDRADGVGRPRVQPEVEPRLDARHAQLLRTRSDAPPLPPRRADLSERVRLPRALDPAAQPRRGRPRQGLADRQDAGRRWQRFANLRCLLAWQWCSPGGQLLFMGAEVAQEREWSHDREVDWWLLAEPAPCRDRRAGRRPQPAPGRAPGAVGRRRRRRHTFWWLDPDDGAHSVFAFCRRAPGDGRTDIVAVVANLTPVPRHGYRLGVPFAGTVAVVLDTDNAGVRRERPRTGSRRRRAAREPDPTTPWQGQPQSLLLTLPPLSVVILAPA